MECNLAALANAGAAFIFAKNKLLVYFFYDIIYSGVENAHVLMLYCSHKGKAAS